MPLQREVASIRRHPFGFWTCCLPVHGYKSYQLTTGFLLILNTEPMEALKTLQPDIPIVEWVHLDSVANKVWKAHQASFVEWKQYT